MVYCKKRGQEMRVGGGEKWGGEEGREEERSCSALMTVADV